MRPERRAVRVAQILAEAGRSARSQPIASAGTLIVAGLLCLMVLLTQGRTVGAARDVISSIDEAGSRSIVVRANPEAGLDSRVLDRLRYLEGIEWVGAFGPALDARNQRIPGGSLVALRAVWSDDLSPLAVRPGVEGIVTAWSTDDGLRRLGMLDATGSASTPDGEFAVVGTLRVPDFLRDLDLALLSPRASASVGEVAVLVVVADHADHVEAIAGATRSVLGVNDPMSVTVETSSTLADIRSTVDGQLGDFGRGLVAALLGLCGVLVAAIVYGLVMFRRRDFGRRRALGASKALILGLVVTQVAGLSLTGATVGSFIGAVALWASGDPTPPLDYVFALVIMCVAIATAAATGPAVAASRREPIRELRVP